MTSPDPSGADGQPARVTLYWSAIWRAAVTTLTFAVPLAVLQTWLVDSERVGKGAGINLLLNFAIMCSGALGGFAAAKLVPTSPLQNGAAAAGLAAVAIQIAGDVRHALVGDDLVGPLVWIFLGLLVATFGMFGAWVNEKTSTRGPTPSHPDHT